MIDHQDLPLWEVETTDQARPLAGVSLTEWLTQVKTQKKREEQKRRKKNAMTHPILTKGESMLMLFFLYVPDVSRSCFW